MHVHIPLIGVVVSLFNVLYIYNSHIGVRVKKGSVTLIGKVRRAIYDDAIISLELTSLVIGNHLTGYPALPPVDTLLEIKGMIEDHSRSWAHQWKAEGWKAGLTEGRQVGLTEGAGTIVQRQLQRKFGVIPPSVQQKIKTATSEQLEAWSLNILDATTLDEVFKD